VASPVPKRRKLPKREHEIGLRLKQIRTHLRLSQDEFAAQIGITRQRLASYEDARTPLRADIGLRLCRQFIISEEWLATGKGLMRQCLDLASEPLSYRIDADAPYSQVYDEFLSSRYAALKKEWGENIRIKTEEGGNFEFIENLLRYHFDQWINELPKQQHDLPQDFPQALCGHLLYEGAKFVDFVIEAKRIPRLGYDIEEARFVPPDLAAKEKKP
jgi:transcriptional regulator with XRE-family HTH domain